MRRRMRMRMMKKKPELLKAAHSRENPPLLLLLPCPISPIFTSTEAPVSLRSRFHKSLASPFTVCVFCLFSTSGCNPFLSFFCLLPVCSTPSLLISSSPHIPHHPPSLLLSLFPTLSSTAHLILHFLLHPPVHYADPPLLVPPSVVLTTLWPEAAPTQNTMEEARSEWHIFPSFPYA